jgi:hypothetical protein
MPLGVTEGVAGGGGTPPTAVKIYPSSATPAAGASICDMESQIAPGWNGAYGIADIVTGLGNSGIGYNGDGLNTYSVPPGNSTTAAFVVGLVNTNATGRTTIDVDTADYLTNYNTGYGGSGYNDIITFAGYGDGGVGATSWSWAVSINFQSLSNGTVASVSGTASTAQNSTYATAGWTGVGQYIFIQPGRSGYVIAGDTFIIDVDVTATNAGGSATASFELVVNFV